MRIAVVNWSSRRAGGIETYLDGVLPALARIGHQVAWCYEGDSPAGRDPITFPPGAPRWCVADLGAERVLAALRDWRPDLIYSHGLADAKFEAETLAIAPAVFFAHAYLGTCISGNKSFKRPVMAPCDRRFGWQCLVHYYPRGCGGWSPLSMLREYRHQSARLKLLRRYQALVTFSEHMREEYVRHDFDPGRITTLPYFPPQQRPSPPGAGRPRSAALSLPLRDDGPPGASAARAAGPRRLLFLGRTERLKGGQVLLQALPLAQSALGRPLHVTFAGDGGDRPLWEREAARLRERAPGVTVEFTGWVEEADLEALWSQCDLAVVPSLWPEPFGLAGPEAALRGVPVAAFAVGGIPEWLKDGVNGHLAPGDPPTAAGLAQAIVRCLREEGHHAALCRGAAAVAARLGGQAHLAELQRVFDGVLRLAGP